MIQIGVLEIYIFIKLLAVFVTGNQNPAVQNIKNCIKKRNTQISILKCFELKRVYSTEDTSYLLYLKIKREKIIDRKFYT